MNETKMAIDSEASARAMMMNAGKLLRSGQLDQAESLYRHLIDNGYVTPNVLSNLAIICKRAKREDEAISLLHQAIDGNPDLPELRFNLGNSLMSKGDLDGAIQSFRTAIGLRLDFPDALYNLGNAYKKNDDLEAAIACYNKALCLQPVFPEALIALGISLKEQNLMRAAITVLQRGLEIMPNHPEGLYSLGIAYQSEGDLKRSAQAYAQCLDVLPSCFQAHYQLDKVYRQMGDRNALDANYKKVICLNPQTADACCRLGVFFMEAGDIQRARRLFETSISLRQDYADAHLSYAMTLLLLEDFAEGWDRYDWRLQKKYSKLYHQCSSHWIAGTWIDSLFIAGEQGVGDQVMFCSMILDILRDASEITVQVDKRLVPLMRRSFPQVNFVDPTYIVPTGQFDACIPMGSLGRHYRRSHSAFPIDNNNYLVANKEQSLELRRHLTDRNQFVIGISWKSIRQDVDLEKSIPLKEMVLSLARPDVSLVSLQYGDTKSDIAEVEQETGIRIITIKSIDNFKDLDGLATLIDCCDLIISASNITIHLAGGLSKPAWMLLKKIPDWRWGLQGSRTWWYPSVKVYRQCHRGQWDEPLEQISHDLALHIDMKDTTHLLDSECAKESTKNIQPFWGEDGDD